CKSTKTNGLAQGHLVESFHTLIHQWRRYCALRFGFYSNFLRAPRRSPVAEAGHHFSIELGVRLPSLAGDHFSIAHRLLVRNELLPADSRIDSTIHVCRHPTAVH